MNDLEGAFRAVLDRPGDVGARLAYADALDARRDPLGEFIRVDCQLSLPSLDEDAALALWDRRLSLLEAHAGLWLAPLAGIVESPCIERGLVERVLLDLDSCLAHGHEIFARFPVRTLAVRGARGRVGELLACPWIVRVEHLELRGPSSSERWNQDFTPAPYTGLEDVDVKELAASDRLRCLRGLDLRDNGRLGPRSVEAILGSSWSKRFEFLGLGSTATGDEGATLLASTGRLASLRRLDLSNCGLGPVGVRALADSATLSRLGLTEFNFSWNNELGHEESIRLLRSPVLRRVEEVMLQDSVDGELVDAVMQSDSLGSMKALCFGSNPAIDTISLRRLTRWQGLERLDRLTFVINPLNDEQLGIVGRSPWLGNLKALRLSETEVTDKGVERFCRSSAWQGLEDLGIDRSGLTERSVHAILAAGWFPRLKVLDLHVSSIGDAGAAALASYRGQTRLRRLIVSMGNIGDAGALALAEAPYAPQLWTLWLLGNRAISSTTCDLLKRRFGGRVHTERSDKGESWRDQPALRA